MTMLKLRVTAHDAHTSLTQFVATRELFRSALRRVVDAGIPDRQALGTALLGWRDRGLSLIETILPDGGQATRLRQALNAGPGFGEFNRFARQLCETEVSKFGSVLLPLSLPYVSEYLDHVVSAFNSLQLLIEEQPDFRTDVVTDCRIFISYDTREIDLAMWIARALESRVGSSVQVFVAKRNIEPGANFLEVMLKENLLQAEVLVALCSRNSHTSPWLWWESSAVWTRSKLVVPLFVDVAPTAFPGPITLLCQGRRLSESSEVSEALETIVRRVNGEFRPLADDELAALNSYVSQTEAGAFKETIDRDTVRSPSTLRLETSADVERTLKVAEAARCVREHQAAIADMKKEVDTLRTAHGEAKKALDDVEERIARGGGWAGCSEWINLYSKQVQYCEARLHELRTRILERNEELGRTHDDLYALEQPALDERPGETS